MLHVLPKRALVFSVLISVCTGITWRLHYKKEYLFVAEKLNWFDAQVVCQSIGGRLAQATNSLENKFLFSLTDKVSSVWLGGSDIHKEGDWKWYNPVTPMTFTYWSPVGPQPNNGRYSNCLAFWKPTSGFYMWADEPCDRKFQFICERPVGFKRSTLLRQAMARRRVLMFKK